MSKNTQNNNGPRADNDPSSIMPASMNRSNSAMFDVTHPARPYPRPRPQACVSSNALHPLHPPDPNPGNREVALERRIHMLMALYRLPFHLVPRSDRPMFLAIVLTMNHCTLPTLRVTATASLTLATEALPGVMKQVVVSVPTAPSMSLSKARTTQITEDWFNGLRIVEITVPSKKIVGSPAGTGRPPVRTLQLLHYVARTDRVCLKTLPVLTVTKNVCRNPLHHTAIDVLPPVLDVLLDSPVVYLYRLAQRQVPINRSETVIDITSSSSSEEDAGCREILPGDSAYRGRNAMSRIESAQTSRRTSPPVTRRQSRKASSGAKSIKTTSNSPSAQNHKTPNLKRTRSDESLKTSSKKPSSVPRYVTVGLPIPPLMIGRRNKKAKRGRQRSHSDPVLSDDPLLPTPTEVLEGTTRRPSGAAFIDNEAVDDDHCSSDDDQASSVNAYDCNDSFIDDDSVYEGDDKPFQRLASERPVDLLSPFTTPSALPEDRRRRQTQGQSPKDDSDAEMDIDGAFPGVDEEDPVVTVHKARYRRLHMHEKDMDGLSVGYENNRSFTLARLEELKDNGGGYDASTYKLGRLARRDSLLSVYRPWHTRQEYQREGARERGLLLDRPPSSYPAKKKGDKGKGKAPVSDWSTGSLNGPKSEPRDESDDDGLSEYERNMRRALNESKDFQARSSRVGEPSRQRESSQSDTAHGLSSSMAYTNHVTDSLRHGGPLGRASLPGPSPATEFPLTPTSHQTGTAVQATSNFSPVTPTSTATSSTPSASSTNAPRTPSSSGGIANQSISPETPSPTSSLSNPGDNFRSAQHVTALPDNCEVNDPLLHDPALAGDYCNLPPLRHCELVPWADLPGPGQVQWSEWENQCQRMNTRLALEFMRFVNNGYFVNPSRASPLGITIRELTSGTSTPRYHAYVGQSPLVALSPVFLEHSQLTEPSATGLHQRFIRGIFHSQEWERAVAYFNMIFGCRRMHAQLARDALQFSTRGTFKAKTDNGSSGSNLRKTASKMFTKNVSCSTVSSYHQNKVTAETFSLPNDANIPVFDARDAVGFNMPSDLTCLSERLPVWHGEIPFGSLVVVAYTVASFRSREGNWTLGCNIQWAVVLGTPEEEE
ncbi:hypothetical protein EST38_g13001 [Candolleomyces aberdarensis]|uniref:Uncharacterized protein n=1 Tax=Candolleomyces aberdarensis TaxID=2316362 RepID=A0A4Q2D117_9AGAR|nr:hypothetical protein EST38_g13001 [Candolleomyces aberdarensis]